MFLLLAKREAISIVCMTDFAVIYNPHSEIAHLDLNVFFYLDLIIINSSIDDYRLIVQLPMYGSMATIKH